MVVISKTTRRYHGSIVWRCKCECGKIRYRTCGDLNSGNSKSCGCGRSKLPVGKKSLYQLFCKYKDSAKKRRYKFELSLQDFEKLSKGNCFFCAAPPCNKNIYCGKKEEIYIYNGIDRLNNDLGYILDNCVSCCSQCNRAKNWISCKDFIRWIQRLNKNIKKNIHLQKYLK